MPRQHSKFNAERLILGTVQCGMPYGIANVVGKPSLDVIRDILKTAFACGIHHLDTASGYGESEKNIGLCLEPQQQRSAMIITKLPPDITSNDAKNLRSYVIQSLQDLHSSSLACLMLHREESLNFLQQKEFAESFAGIKYSGIAKALGCSVYSPEKALEAIRHPLIDVVQIPTSLFDRRFERAGVFAEAKLYGKTLHIRSALLQGVLCMASDKLPAHLGKLTHYVNELHAICQAYSLPPAVAAMQWLLRRYPEAQILFGAETAEQVQETAKCQKQPIPDALYYAMELLYPPQCPCLLNPALWSKQ